MYQKTLIIIILLLQACGEGIKVDVSSNPNAVYKTKYKPILEEVIRLKKEDFMKSSDYDSSYYTNKFHKIFSLKNLNSDLTRRLDEQIDSFIIELSMQCSIDINTGKITHY